ncbi:MAG: alpha/beta hydrolase fold domain-containing protein [Bacteroidetes bacterium]|nr:alpha/beta hydrolase fold domain-containing protein [Bacteroidota bacterium]
MSISRKKFLQQSACVLAGACLPYSKLFAKLPDPLKKITGDTYHPVDCLPIGLGTGKYKYSESDIQIDGGFYSKLYNGGYTVNGFCNDVEYALEGDSPDNGPVGCGDPNINACLKVDFQNSNPFRYRVYYPKTTKHDYDSRPLPVCIFFHAGGFKECSVYGDPVITNLCMFLARKGYICFSVEYRRGRIIDFTNYPNIQVSVQQQLARYRGIQDGCGAIRSFMKRNMSGDPQKFPFTFDTTQVFIGGDSEGGIIALGCAYYRTSADLVTNQNMIDSTFPKTSGSPPLKSILGNMHTDYYYAPVDSQYWPTFAGVISLWGGLVIPHSLDGNNDNGTHEVNFFKYGAPGTFDNPPLICFHGALDNVIPFYDYPVGSLSQDYDLSPYQSNASSNYNAENLCTKNADINCTTSGNTFTQKAISNTIELKLMSSLNMYHVMKQLNRFSELYVDCFAHHGLDADDAACGTCTLEPDNKFKKPLDENNCQDCAYQSSYGTDSNSQEATTEYFAGRIAVFTHANMYYRIHFPSTPVLTFGALGESFFKDCENKRECNQLSNPDPCNDTTLCDGSPLFPETTE